MNISKLDSINIDLSFSKEHYLVPPIGISIRNEVDRYGFSYLLAEMFNLKNVPRSFASWNHGWIWGPIDAPEYNFPGKMLCPTNIQHIVHRPVLKKQLIEHGVANVQLGKLPFAFTLPSGNQRIKNSLLVILQHTGFDISIKDKMFINNLLKIKHQFSMISFCLFDEPAQDKKNKTIMTICRKHGFRVLVGAIKEDKNCLPRLRAIYDTHEYMFTNGIGSHVLYAAYSGCKIAVAKPPYYADFSDSPDPRSRFLYSYENIRKWMPNFFTDNPKHATTYYDWSFEEIGASYTLSEAEIKDLLGWSLGGKIKAACRFLKRKLQA